MLKREGVIAFPLVLVLDINELRGLLGSVPIGASGTLERDGVGGLRRGLPCRLLCLLRFGRCRLGLARLGGVGTADWIHHNPPHRQKQRKL